ncbi:MAG: hypothetical protein WAM14_09330 [Candidatus Nitrosopolaris sp.]
MFGRTSGNRLSTDDANNRKASWSQFYIDDFATAKVKILYIGRGKFRILDDKEGGKYVGRIVDASDLNHCEI